MTTPTRLLYLWLRLSTRLRTALHSDRGSASDNIIWIAFLTGTAIGVTVLLGPKIMEAANSIRFK
ncbi:hypothetical protein [Streptomyces boninensis]|uniref:hypothetical protein n=1 Tax=Streptomyces boninensis TaxID=2039455 RepID=UPI003B227D7E